MEQRFRQRYTGENNSTKLKILNRKTTKTIKNNDPTSAELDTVKNTDNKDSVHKTNICTSYLSPKELQQGLTTKNQPQINLQSTVTSAELGTAKNTNKKDSVHKINNCTLHSSPKELQQGLSTRSRPQINLHSSATPQS
jgi:hypothetical protein